MIIVLDGYLLFWLLSENDSRRENQLLNDSYFPN